MVALCVVSTAPIDCVWVRYVTFIFPATVPITILIFLFRIHALWQNMYLLVFVFCSWLLVLGSSIAVAFRTYGVNIEGTNFCTVKPVERDVSDSVSTMTRFVHDTLVFIVTSYWLYQMPNPVDNRSSGFTTDALGKHLMPMARSLLHDGQAYYLATLILNVIVIILPLLSNPFVTPCTLGGPLFVLVSNLACHVYRNLVNMKYRDHEVFLQLYDGRWGGVGLVNIEMSPRTQTGITWAVRRVESAESSV